MKISIIIPIYNIMKKLPQMLSCIQRQIEKDFEVIMVDDGSTDASGKICDEISKNDNRFKVIHQENRGVSEARNRGMQVAQGEYITFLDADDEIPENYLYELIRTQKETSADIVVCDVVILCDKKENRRFTYYNSILNQKQALNFLLSRKYINSGPCAKLFSAKILKGIQFPSLKVYEDILFVRDAFSKSEKIVITNKTEYRYFQNNESAMGKNKKNPSIDVVKATRDIVGFLNKNKELDSYCLYITLSHLMQYIQMIGKNRNKNDIEQNIFVSETKKVFWDYRYQILFCKSFPWKEKILFLWTAMKK